MRTRATRRGRAGGEVTRKKDTDNAEKTQADVPFSTESESPVGCRTTSEVAHKLKPRICQQCDQPSLLYKNKRHMKYCRFCKLYYNLHQKAQRDTKRGFKLKPSTYAIRGAMSHLLTTGHCVLDIIPLHDYDRNVSLRRRHCNVNYRTENARN